MAYKDPITWEIVSWKSKKKTTTKLRKVKSRVGEIVWWIASDLKLEVWKIKKELEGKYIISPRDGSGEVEVKEWKLRRWNDDDYYLN